MTKAEAKKYHKKMWLWLAKNPNKNKHDWPEWDFNGGDIQYVYGHCFACYFDDEFFEGLECENCPIKWIKKKGVDSWIVCENPDSPFHKWYSTRDLVIRSRLARQIANMWK